MEEIFNKLIKAGITPNAFYILYSIHKNVQPNKYVSAPLAVTQLKAEGWLDESSRLTDRALIFVQEIDSYFKKHKKATSKALLGEDFLTKIDEYLEIFPKFKLPSGKYARVDKKTLEAGFKWFFENYTYEWETILNATRMYVDEYERQSFKYMRTSQYFIRKASNIGKTYESELATYCEVYMNGDTDYNDDGYFKEKVV
jgi:hypothetical protein